MTHASTTFVLALSLSLVSACALASGDDVEDDASAGAAASQDDDTSLGGKEDSSRVCADGETTLGIDVSRHQGTIDWQRVADAGVKFAFVRVSDGARVHDSKFQQNWDGAKAAGLLVGTYQFFRPAQSIDAQVEIMLDALRDNWTWGDLPPVIDVEATGNMGPRKIQAKLAEWSAKVEAVIGVKPIIYTGKYFWRDEVGGPTEYGDNPLWIGQYTRNGNCPSLMAPWQRWTFWQYSDHGDVEGIPADADMNVFNGSLDELYTFAYGF